MRDMAPTIPPDLRFGFEFEVSAGASDLARRLYSLGMLPYEGLHPYHCDCDECEADPNRAHVYHAQQDCTVAGEFISRPLHWGDDETHNAIATLSREAIAARATADRNAGCHVHVSAHLLDQSQRADIMRTMLAYLDEYGTLAGGKAKAVRGYNGTIDGFANYWNDDRYLLSGRSSWLNNSGFNTVEFRLWNGTVTDWRVRMYAGVSLATVLAVLDGNVPDRNPNNTLADHLADYLPDDVPELMKRQRDYVTNL